MIRIFMMDCDCCGMQLTDEWRQQRHLRGQAIGLQLQCTDLSSQSVNSSTYLSTRLYKVIQYPTTRQESEYQQEKIGPTGSLLQESN